jgi:flavin-dependent dehydrogenase
LLGYGRQRLSGAAYVRAFPLAGEGLEPFRGAVLFHPSATLRGYGWVFPKRDHLNVGIYSQRPLDRTFLRDLDAYLRYLGIESWSRRGPFAAPIPAEARVGELARGRVFLAGDAAGLADPVTGEGISHAMASGGAAAETIHTALGRRAGPDEASRDYRGRLRAEVLPALGRLKTVGNALYSLGPRGIERAMAFPPARFAVRRLGWWESASGGGGSLVVESHSHKQ